MARKTPIKRKTTRKATKVARTRKKAAPAKPRATSPQAEYPPMPIDPLDRSNKYIREHQDGSVFVYVPAAEWANVIQSKGIAKKGPDTDAPQIAGKSSTANGAVQNSLSYLASMVYMLYHANDRLNFKLDSLRRVISRMNGVEVPPLEKITDVNESKLLHSLDEQNQIHNRLLDELDTCLIELTQLV